jgi:hypothetical protein
VWDSKPVTIIIIIALTPTPTSTLQLSKQCQPTWNNMKGMPASTGIGSGFK